MNQKKFEILTDKMELAKKHLKQFCDSWVIKGIIKSENQIRFSENNIDISKNWDDIKLILFLSKKRRTTEISISNLSPNVIENTINYCEKLLNVAKINRYYKRLPEGPFNYNSSIQDKIFDNKVANLDEKAIDLVENATEASLSQGAKRVAGSFFFGNSHYFLETSTNIEQNFKKTHLNFRIRAFAEDMYATGEALSCSTHLKKGFDAVGAGEEAGKICKMAVGGKKGKPGIYNIIIYPKISTELQAPTPAIAMNEYIRKMGLSWLIGKRLGDKIASEKISAWDDGTIEYGLGSSPFDDECVPTKKTLLIDKGIIHQYFTNTSLARKNQESTGNAGITMPQPSNTVFAAGDHTLEELMEISEKPTLLVTSTWYTRYQSYAPPGILSSLPKDGMFLVKNKGKILEPVRELRINSNHYHMLEHTIGLGKKLKQVSTWLSPTSNPVFAPFMLIEDIKMTTGTK
ncbi:MAG: TldD/PmbA family protein [Promethearchaeota archaeon]|nr:MAG: TldD/PmbA family protein [Candidatus Lokiarchaeota archaeon]